jgi:hypothetical protein
MWLSFAYNTLILTPLLPLTTALSSLITPVSSYNYYSPIVQVAEMAAAFAAVDKLRLDALAEGRETRAALAALQASAAQDQRAAAATESMFRAQVAAGAHVEAELVRAG